MVEYRLLLLSCVFVWSGGGYSEARSTRGTEGTSPQRVSSAAETGSGSLVRGIKEPARRRDAARGHGWTGTTLGTMRLALELAAARAAGRLSRLAGRGGGTTLPGKLLATVDPRAVSVLAERLPLGTALLSATNGKTTTASLAAGILSPRIRLAHNSSGANLVSGVASTLLEARGCRARPVRGGRGGVPDRRRAPPPARGVPRQPLSRPARPVRRARADRRALARRGRRPAGVLDARRQRRRSAGRRPGRLRPGSVTFGVDDPAQARPSLQHAADSKYCLRCGAPVHVRGCLRRPSRRLPLSRLRSRPPRARRSRPGRSSWTGWTASGSTS